MNLIFHAGAPRTGSTTIQRTLAQKFDNNSETLVVQPRARSTELEIHLNKSCKIPNSKLLGRTAAAKTAKLLKKYELQGYKTVIITEEGFAGPMLGRANSLFNLIDTFYSHVFHLNKSYPCKVITFVRNHHAYLTSCYRFRVQKGYTNSAEYFFNDLDSSQLSWTKVLTKAEKHNILDLVQAVDFDQFIKNSDSLNRSLLPHGFSDFECAKPNNPSIKSNLVLEFVRQYSLSSDSLLDKPTRIEQRMKISNLDLINALEYIYGYNPHFEKCHIITRKNEDSNFPHFSFTDQQRGLLKNITLSDAKWLSDHQNAVGNFEKWIT